MRLTGVLSRATPSFLVCIDDGSLCFQPSYRGRRGAGPRLEDIRRRQRVGQDGRFEASTE